MTSSRGSALLGAILLLIAAYLVWALFIWEDPYEVERRERGFQPALPQDDHGWSWRFDPTWEGYTWAPPSPYAYWERR